MTKAAALLLAGSLALSACASDEDGGDNGGTSSGGGSDELKVGVAYDTGGRGDRSFNDSAIAGVEAAIEELGGEIKELSAQRRRLQPRRAAHPAGRRRATTRSSPSASPTAT